MKRKKPIVEQIPEDYGERLDLIVKILTTHLTKGNKEVLFNVLREIQKTREISIEFIEYLLLGVEKKSELKQISLEERNKAMFKMRDFQRLLKKSGVNIELRPVTYSRWKRDIDLIKVPCQRTMRFFKL